MEVRAQFPEPISRDIFISPWAAGLTHDAVFTIPVLVPGDSYVGPTGSSDASDLCKCNTVVYSLMSACDACQDALWFSYVFRSTGTLCVFLLRRRRSWVIVWHDMT